MMKQIISDNKFDLHYLNKFGSLMTLGNGYLGLRASHEENYTEQTRGMYVAGIFNKATANETSDLVNLPDLIGMKLEIDGEIFSLQNGEVIKYERYLNMANGELNRHIEWKSKKTGSRYQFVFNRFVAKNDLHLFATKLTVTSLDKTTKIKIVTGIDGQQTNFGRQHLIEEKVLVIDEKIMQGIYTTTESGHTVALATSCLIDSESDVSFASKNRQLLTTIKHDLSINQPFVLEKYNTVYTSLDQDIDGQDIETTSIAALKAHIEMGYAALLERSAEKWNDFWKEKRVIVRSQNEFDQLALDFALYHIEIMTPSHDERFSIGAKGLTGEGYKGHVFWDTEIFLAPFHLYTEPEKAKRLLKYRYINMEQAKEKARNNGYEGALFPWESAFSGKEETPEYAAINIKTGKRQKVASAIAEHHIVADIAYAVVQYYQNTKDDDFMKLEGLALLKETSLFWISRSTEKNGRLELHDVIGPDEYTEHINNNAYTNYMAHYNVEQALYFMKKYEDIDEELVIKGQDFLERLYLPLPNEDNILPQDDTFLQKPEIDLTKYKANQGSQGILLDYSRQEVNEMQILKQADVVMLLYLFPNLFSDETVSKNLHYYENHTIHDSSLSKAIHAIVAARCNEIDTAYQFYQEACLIDLGPNPHSSDEGLHAASLGALWLSTMFGFANITCKNHVLHISPKIPKEWSKLSFPFYWQGSKLQIVITHENVKITKVSGPELAVVINGSNYLVNDTIIA